MAAMISNAARNREERVERGETVRQEVKATAPIAAATPGAAFDLAALVSSAARDREKRLFVDGGEKKMTSVVIKEKGEYKEQFNSIAVEAAELGRLTRLHEHCVEGVAGEKDPLQDEEARWKSKGLMAIEWRTNHMSVIHEAAKLGNETVREGKKRDGMDTVGLRACSGVLIHLVFLSTL